MSRRPLGLTLIAAVALGASLLLAPAADAFVYWANTNAGAFTGTTIGRANLDGTGVNQSFIGGADGPCGLAVTDSQIFWGNNTSGTGTDIGRANIDGSGVDQSFVTTANEPCVGDADGTYVYWANFGDDTLGRATFDASTVEPAFVNPAHSLPCGAAVNSTDVYWPNQSGNAIGRALISGANPDSTFFGVAGGTGPCGIAVNSAHVYWVGFIGGNVGRANLDGSGVNDGFITGLGKPCGIAVTDTHIYWSDSFTGNIGRANLDGTGVTPAFITGAGAPCGVAADERVLPTAAGVACERQASAFNQPTACTVTVSDQGPAATATAPAGTVSFASASGGAGFRGGSSCTLSPAGTGRSRCSVTFLPGTGINLLQAIYGGDPEAHAGSSAITQVAVGGFSIGSPVLDTVNGAGTLSATVPGPGTVSLQGAGLLPATASAAAAGQLTVPLVPDAGSAALLAKGGSAPVSAAVSYLPAGGGASATRTLTATLQKSVKQPKKKHKKHKRKKRKGRR